MKYLILRVKLVIFIFTFFMNFAYADFNTLLSAPQGGISSEVWQGALTSYMSQCSSSECPCVLVIAEGISGQDTSANMWIGTFKGGMATELWSGYASRFANNGQNDRSVSMDTDLCKRRNGVAEVSNGQACIPKRKCKDPSVYKNLADQLGLPEGVALTSFYFSTPMQNETYKFHDFYACNSPPCPATLGCLGLERHAMKSLCLNYMGSDGSNGINAQENGGAWLYFHNEGPPSQNTGSLPMAGQGFNKFAEGGLCSHIPTVSLSSGEIVSGTDYSGSGSDSSNSASSGENAMSLISGTGDIVNQRLQEQQQNRGLPSISEEHEQFQKSIEEQRALTTESCVKTTTEACPNAESSAISEYCADPEGVERSGCEFGGES